MAIKRSTTMTTLYMLITSSGVLLLAACGFLPFERVDYKAYPTAANPNDFFGRVYARTRVEEVKVQPASNAAQASQEVGFPVRLPAYIPQGFGLVDKIIGNQSHAYRVDIDLSMARALLESANLPTDGLPATPQQISIDVSLPPGALTYQESDQDYVTFIQTRNPSYDPPAGVDPALLDELGKLGWQYLGLTQEEAAQLNQRMGWAFFLALPPAGMQSAEIVDINGITGVALDSSSGDPEDRAILWELDGVLYGLYSDLPLSELNKIAGSLE
jgi:hypothetical protein